MPIHDDNPRRWVSAPYVGWAIIALCTLIFVWQTGLDPRQQYQLLMGYGFIPAVYFDHGVLAPHLAGLPTEATAVSSLFLHAGAWHLIGNMLFLYIFGGNVEDSCGHWRFLVFYLLCGVIAALTHGLMEEDSLAPLVGASGAISGILGAYLLLRPLAKITALIVVFPVTMPIWVWVGGWFAFQALGASAIVGDELVAHWAHIGGFLAGVALIPLLKHDEVRLLSRA